MDKPPRFHLLYITHIQGIQKSVGNNIFLLDQIILTTKAGSCLDSWADLDWHDGVNPTELLTSLFYTIPYC